MLKRGWLWTIVGGALPVAAGFGTSLFPEDKHAHNWAAPLTPHVFMGLSVVLAVAHLLIAVGYDDIADRSGGGAARSFLQVAGLGLLIDAGVEIWSATLASAEHDSPAIAQLNTGYALAASMIVIGTVGAALMLLKSWPVVAIPLLVSGAILLLAVAPAFAWSVMGKGDLPRVAALTAWSASYIVLGVAMLTRRRPRPARR